MRRLIFISCLLWSGFAFAETKEIKISVKGMVCGFCAQGITKKFSAEPAVAKVDVSLEKKLVTIELKNNQDIPNMRIETILKESGYNVEKIDRSAP